ncbi:uncharacterized protein LOC123506000 [Portunus trituberculatus]|uniref:uncharacterized protein LOC123506000 n=1 Tax=Portunus trituberculatus TaxID=210409 RepID=UPI001E1CF295|nr:uncharacterized protein LOC123506000 [Portunus trituberculatus]
MQCWTVGNFAMLEGSWVSVIQTNIARGYHPQFHSHQPSSQLYIHYPAPYKPQLFHPTDVCHYREDMAESQTCLRELKNNRKVQNVEATCNSCIIKVKGKDALTHLFFGPLQCANCLFSMNNCQSFRRNYPAAGKCPKTRRPHSMTKWVKPVLNYLNYCARKEIVISSSYDSNKSRSTDILNDIATSYLRSLLPLKDIMPWRLAFRDPSIQTIMRTMVLLSESQESESQNKIMQQSQTESTQKISSHLTTSASLALPKFSSQKRKVMQERDKQQSTLPKQEHLNNPLVIAHATRTSQEKTEVREKESSKIKHKDLPLVTQAPKISTSQENKTRQNSTKDASWDNTMADSKQVVTERISELSVKNFTSGLSLSKRKEKPRKEGKKPYLDVIPKNVLHSMNYLVVQLSPQLCLEECPNCYCPFNAEMCYVNTSTCVLDLLCADCDLAVYIVPKDLYGEPE